MIKRVFFDIGDVLVHYQPQNFFKFLAERCRSENDPKLFFSGEVFLAYESGELNTAEFFDVMGHMLGLDPQDYQLTYYMFGRVLKPDPAMITLKRNLKTTRVKIGIISNNNPFHIAILKHEYPEVFEGTDVQIYSHIVGSRKPDKAIYLAAFEAAKADPRECLLIDDRAENVEAFRKLNGIGYHYQTRNRNLATDMASVDAANRRLSDFFDSLGLRKIKDLS